MAGHGTKRAGLELHVTAGRRRRAEEGRSNAYPRIGNEDWPAAERMEAAALKKTETAVPSADDPPEFAVWLIALQRPGLPVNEREEIYWAIHDDFGAVRKSAV